MPFGKLPVYQEREVQHSHRWTQAKCRLSQTGWSRPSISSFCSFWASQTFTQDSSACASITFHWTPSEKTPFSNLKWLFASAQILQIPDHRYHFVVKVETTTIEVGDILSQHSVEDKMCFFSQHLTLNETNYENYWQPGAVNSETGPGGVATPVGRGQGANPGMDLPQEPWIHPLCKEAELSSNLLTSFLQSVKLHSEHCFPNCCLPMDVLSNRHPHFSQAF